MNTEPKFVKIDLPLNHPLLPKHYDNDGSKPEDELKALNTTIEQASACYKDGHYIASIGLCGRIIEILIVNAYKREFRSDPLTAEIDHRTERVTPMSVRIMRRRLQGRSVRLFDDVVDSKLNFIQNSRNISAHGSVTIPEKPDAKNVADYTIQFIERIIYYYTAESDPIQRGKVRENFGNHKGAIEDFDRVIDGKEKPKNLDLAEAYYNRGLSKAALNEYEEAITDFTESINRKWSLAKNYLNRGKAKFSLGQSAEAITDFDEAIKRREKLQESDLAEVYYNRGLTKNVQGLHEEATKDFDKAIDHKKDLAEAYYNRGLVKRDLAMFEAAIVDFDRTLRLDPDNAAAYKARGLAKCRLDLYKSAIVDFSDVIDLKSDLADAYFQRGRARNEIGEYNNAIADFDKSIGEKTDYIDAYFQRGFVKNELKQYKEAIRDFNRVITENPDYTDAYFQRGLAEAELDRHEDAIKDYNKAIRLKSDDTDAYYNRGNAEADLKQYEAAIRSYNKAIEFNSEDAEAYYERGCAKEILGEYKAAISDFDEAIRLEPDSAAAYHRREQLQEALENHEAAEVDFANAKYHDDRSSHPKDIQTEREAEGEESEFWAPIRRGEFGELFAGQPVPIGNDGSISKHIHGVEVILSFRKNRSYVSFLCTGENRIERRDEIIALFPEADYDYYPRESPQRAGFGFDIINKGKDHPEDWDEIREKLVTMGTDIYNKIKESDL